MSEMSEQTAVAILLAYMGVVAVLFIGYYIIQVIAYWRIFTKAGEAGWKSIIPFYNSYVLYKIAWQTVMFWIVAALFIVGNFLNGLDNSMVSILGWLLLIGATVIGWVQKFKLSKAFGHEVGFAIGLILLNPIFILILGFGKDQYQGPQ